MHLQGSIKGLSTLSPVERQIRHYFEFSFLSSNEHRESSFSSVFLDSHYNEISLMINLILPNLI